MSSICICAPARTYKVIVVGIKGCQFHFLRSILNSYPVEIRALSPEQLLRLRSADSLIILTRFANHKHSNHAKSITPDVIRVGHGAARAVADTILAYFDLVG